MDRAHGQLLMKKVQETVTGKRSASQRHYTALNYKGVWYSSIILIDSRSAMDDACTMATTNEAASQASHNGEQKATDGGQKLLRRLKRP
ncbi:hypothetical protein WJX79_010340 [Trebouxia sp. C0005]